MSHWHSILTKRRLINKINYAQSTSYSSYLLLTQDDVVNTKHNKNMMITDTTEVAQFQNQKYKAHKQYSKNTHKLWITRKGSMEI